jgi:sugar lactone lactonase YvrE
MEIKMNYLTYTLPALLMMVALLACNQTTNDNGLQPDLSGDTEAPVVSLAASATNFRSPDTLILTATATDNEGVRGVEFFEGDVLSGVRALDLEPLQENKVGEATTEPFTLELPIENGRGIVRTFHAKATDEAGNVGSSLAVTVAINIELGTLSVRAFPINFNGTFQPDILVTGPNGFERRITNAASSFLTNLELGVYTFTPNDVVGSDDVADVVLEADAETLELSRGLTFANVDIPYRPRPDTGKLWLPVRNEHKLIALSPSNLSFSSAASPAIAVGTGATSAPNAVAFDASGNLWMPHTLEAKLLMFTPEQLASSGTPTPRVTLDGTSFLRRPAGLAFDSEGSLWVANSATNDIVRYRADQLSSSGAPIPAILTSPSIVRPFGVAFDAAGNLWVSDDRLGSVVMFPKASLDFLNNIPAAVTIFAPLPRGLAFDKDGNLWVASLGGSLARFPVQGVTSGIVQPDIVLRDNNGTLASPAGLAFDNTGRLYVTNVTTKTLAVFEPSALVSSGSPTARLVSALGNTAVALPAFNLPPEALPLSR